MGGAGVVQRGQRAQQPQVRVGDLLHVVDGPQELADTAVGQRLALQRYDDVARGGQAVERQHAE
ncbi:Uncharacterised protein [Mycobacteroides abscessus subsp. abscessus]|nr:Uncharacterised protein [Mycobacteroides abscessus subsp. abscessus]